MKTGHPPRVPEQPQHLIPRLISFILHFSFQIYPDFEPLVWCMKDRPMLTLGNDAKSTIILFSRQHM